MNHKPKPQTGFRCHDEKLHLPTCEWRCSQNNSEASRASFGEPRGAGVGGKGGEEPVSEEYDVFSNRNLHLVSGRQPKETFNTTFSSFYSEAEGIS